jgi:hypothetical protein
MVVPRRRTAAECHAHARKRHRGRLVRKRRPEEVADDATTGQWPTRTSAGISRSAYPLKALAKQLAQGRGVSYTERSATRAGDKSFFERKGLLQYGRSGIAASYSSFGNKKRAEIRYTGWGRDVSIKAPAAAKVTTTLKGADGPFLPKAPNR